MTIGVAVIGAGMAGRAHAAAYRIAPTLYRVHIAGPAFCLHRRRQSGAGLARGPALRIRAQRHLLAGDCRGPRHQCRQRGRGQLPASRDGGGAGRRRQARALREAAERQPRGCPRYGGPRPQRQHGGPHRLHLPPGARRRCPPGARHLWRAGSHSAHRRPLLVRLRERPEGADELAVQGSSGLRRARRHRQSRRVPRRVPRWGCAGGERRPICDRDHGAPGATRHRRRPWASRGERHL